MNTAVFIAWRGGPPERGEWSPVARLDRVGGEYRFVYTHGARMLPGFHSFPGMSDLEEAYRSETLFPLFANRLLSRSRPEYEAWLTWSGFDPQRPPEPMALLSVTEGIRQTDALEVFPCPVADAADGKYRTLFFLHGLRHALPQAQARLATLQAGDALSIELEDHNAHDPQAVAVWVDGEVRLRLGYVPRYLARDARTLVNQVGADAIDLRVVRINPGAPLQMRLLCRLSAPWPRGFDPCSGIEFQPIVDDVALAQVVHA
jgi:HIRAN domain